MKRRLNFITLLLALAFGLCLVSTLYQSVADFRAGWNSKQHADDGQNKKECESVPETNLQLWLNLVPTNHFPSTDSIYNVKSATWIPAEIQQVRVEIAERRMPMLVLVPVAILLVATGILIFVCFLKLVWSVNASVIFDRSNVKRLRYIGLGFVILFLEHTIESFYFLKVAEELVEIPGYALSAGDVMNAGSLILGMVSFLFAEIFSIGLRLREEQELTI